MMEKEEYKPENALDELLSGLWAISISARHLAAMVNELKERSQKDEQNVRIGCCCKRTSSLR